MKVEVADSSDIIALLRTRNQVGCYCILEDWPTIMKDFVLLVALDISWFRSLIPDRHTESLDIRFSNAHLMNIDMLIKNLNYRSERTMYVKECKVFLLMLFFSSLMRKKYNCAIAGNPYGIIISEASIYCFRFFLY